jgi:hypothetical protein
MLSSQTKNTIHQPPSFFSSTSQSQLTKTTVSSREIPHYSLPSLQVTNLPDKKEGGPSSSAFFEKVKIDVMSEGATIAIVAVVGFIGTVVVFFCGFRYATKCMG